MLARGSEYGMADTDARARIDAWMASRDGEFAVYAAAGARDGIAFAGEAARDPERFDALNDPAWLKGHFTAVHGEQAVAG